MIDRQFQPPCVPPRVKHRWTLQDVCAVCGEKRITGKERVREWRRITRQTRSFQNG